MNKLIIGTMLAVGLCCAKVNYNKVMDGLGGNCKFRSDLSEEFDEKVFSCDNGLIWFDFAKYEIIVRCDTIIDGKKYELIFLFNRSWNKKGNQIHKEKSTIAIVRDEFGTVVNTASGKWSGEGGDFYKRFKENVYYEKQETYKTSTYKSLLEEAKEKERLNQERYNNEHYYDNTPVQQMKSESLSENCWGDPNGSWFCE